MRARLVRALFVLVVVAILAGIAWSFFATPATLVATADGLILTEESLSRRFGVVVAYVVIGAVGAFTWSWWAESRLRWLGPWIVAVYLVALCVGAAITWQVGVWLGPPDPSSIGGLAAGTEIRDRLAIDSWVPMLVWPIIGMFVLMFATYWNVPSDRARDVTGGE